MGEAVTFEDASRKGCDGLTIFLPSSPMTGLAGGRGSFQPTDGSSQEGPTEGGCGESCAGECDAGPGAKATGGGTRAPSTKGDIECFFFLLCL